MFYLWTFWQWSCFLKVHISLIFLKPWEKPYCVGNKANVNLKIGVFSYDLCSVSFVHIQRHLSLLSITYTVYDDQRRKISVSLEDNKVTSWFYKDDSAKFLKRILSKCSFILYKKTVTKT